MGFPDDRDRVLIRKAERTEALANELAHWLAEFNEGLFAGERFKLLGISIPRDSARAFC